MSSGQITLQKAKELGFNVVEDGRYSQVLHDVVVAYQASRRSGSANTKTKAEVNLSGSKPWRQKGTGRARAGYKSSPVWVGGGVVFGPKPRDYSKNVTKAERRLALRKAFSLRLIASEVLSLQSVEVQSPKTKLFVRQLPTESSGKSLLVVSVSFGEPTYLAARNVPNVHLKTTSEVNAEDLMRYKYVAITEEAVIELSKRAN
jgi:large subunit ribosomal protein L4